MSEAVKIIERMKRSPSKQPTVFFAKTILVYDPQYAWMTPDEKGNIIKEIRNILSS